MDEPMFLTEPEPERGRAVPVADGVWRVVAGNPGPMTYHGTNSYLLGSTRGWVVLDPGPDDSRHVAALVAATGGRVALILVSHAHADHLGAAAGLARATGAAVAGWHAAGPGYDVTLRDEAAVGGLTVLHTPGHAADHVCFARPDGLLFSGDHVMSWSSSAVPPSGGGMGAYLASLDRLAAWPVRRLLPGHGPPMDQPARFLAALAAHRRRREQTIARVLGEQAASLPDLVGRLYRGLDARRHRAAELTTLAHLMKLEVEGRAMRDGEQWRMTAP